MASHNSCLPDYYSSNRWGVSSHGGARQHVGPEHGRGLIDKGKNEFFDNMDFAKKLKKHFTVKELVDRGISKSSAYAWRGPYAFPSEANRKKLEQLLEEKLRCQSMTTSVETMSVGTTSLT